MDHRYLGPEKLRVSAIGYGCPPFSGRLSSEDEKRAIAVLERALELGVTYIDTADHNKGNNEEILAKALKGRRHQVVLATKFGNLRGHDRDDGRLVDGRPQYVRAATEASLNRLQTDYVDLLYLHRVDPQVPIEETVGAMKRMVEEGKARHIGLSEAGPETLRRGGAVHPITAVESEYSLLTRDYERDTIPACRALGIGFVAYYPVGRGLLSASRRDLQELAPKDSRRTSPRFREDHFRQNLKLHAALGEIAHERHCTISQLALAWLLMQGDFIVPIPGTSKIEHLEENVAAAGIGLSRDDVEHISTLFAPGVVAGNRHPEDRSKELNI
jgi:aryl-alcohol dehydrogenase-like predicted oxidoreductase